MYLFRFEQILHFKYRKCNEVQLKDLWDLDVTLFTALTSPPFRLTGHVKHAYDERIAAE